MKSIHKYIELFRRLHQSPKYRRKFGNSQLHLKIVGQFRAVMHRKGII